MKEKVLGFFTGSFLFLLFPYVITIFVNGMDTALLNRPLDLEACLPGMVSLQIPADYEPETVKCQTIIARTNLYRRIQQEKELGAVLEELRERVGKAKNYCFFPEKIYEEAVLQTEGLVLYHERELKLVPFHEVSGGMTRDGAEVLHDEAFSYLKSVDSRADRTSPDYLNGTYISQQQMPKELKVKNRDSAGYVTCLVADGNVLEGEAFRQGMRLESSNFTIQRVGEEYRLLCKGKGHGLGFSQYGGNEIAREGGKYQDILAVYFPEMEIGSVENQE